MLKVLMYSRDVLQSDLVAALLPSFSILDTASTESQEWFGIETPQYDAVILDLDLDEWCDILTHYRQAPFHPPIISLASAGDVRKIVLSLRMGAYDWLAKPAESQDLLRVLSTAVSKSDIILERSDDPVFSGFLGDSSAVRKVKALICKFASAQQPVLLSGESGTGKGVAAQALHDMSGRSDGPFYARNCGAFAPNLIESELFGTLAGSYTGAVDRPGCIEMSTGGSLFLDEIGELSLQSQVKLLRVIEEGVYYRLGSTTLLTADTRFITATNRNLKEMVRTGAFREDLYYRLNILAISIPPLRERREDLPLLCAFFLKDEQKRLDDRALDRILDYSWPGNIRELKSCLSRAVLLAEGSTIQADDLWI
jgi:DNA-binding NtrC family response regulator